MNGSLRLASCVVTLGVLAGAGHAHRVETEELAAASPSSGDWPQFRGPGGGGVAEGAEPYPAALDVEANLLWRAALPPGHSSPIVVGPDVFVTAALDGELLTICLARATGSERWRRAVPVRTEERLHEVNSPASPTPVSDGELVVSYFGSFGLVAHDVDGDELWSRPLPTPRNSFGTAASPILADGKLIFVSDSGRPGGGAGEASEAGTSYLEAIDPATGETLWRVDRGRFGSGWSTPVVREVDGVKELLVYGVWWLTAYDLGDGRERWSVPGLTDEPITMPALGDGAVFVTSYNMRTNTEVIGIPPFADLVAGYDTDGDGSLDAEEAAKNGSILSRHDADGEGDHPLSMFFRFLDVDRDGELTAEEWPKVLAWLEGMRHLNAVIAIRPAQGGTGAESPDREGARSGGLSALAGEVPAEQDAPRGAEVLWQHPRGVPECPSPLYLDGCLHLVKNGGVATCLDTSSGELHYESRLDSRGPVYASPVAADGKVYLASARGTVTIYTPGPELEILSRNDLGARIMATPALAGGVVFVRTETELLAFGTEG